MPSPQSTKSGTEQEKTEEPLLDAQKHDDGEPPELPLPTASSQSIHSSTGPENPEEPLPDEQKHDSREQPELPKMWDLDDPFLYAPPKTDRDPWSILLEPLLQKDKIRCDAWKEEVQNLLIFAGLFSAVVTAFITESYKTLTPDPNDAIISLLSVIANHLDNTTNATPTPVLLSSIGPGSSFSPTVSSIRINSFWFISLVLSLATVLIGIIALQWIREYQNYSNLPPKESFALFNMRADGLEKWHVPKIFTALPLLLQSALILFLGGIIDFLLAFGDPAVAVPVSVVTGLVLLFLLATTILPALQSILLCLPYPYTRTSKVPPAQCPYKSPQAHAFRAILSSAIRLCVKISRDRNSLSMFSYRIIDFVTYITTTWKKKTWTGFDMAWLRLRDRFVQRSYDRLGKRSTNDIDKDVPVFDLTRALMASVYSRETGHVENSLSAQYHCFAEISAWITDRDVFPTLMGEADHQAVHRTNAYIRDIMNYNGIDFAAGLSDFLDFTTGNDSRDLFSFRPSIIWVSNLLHQENMVLFLHELEKSRYVDFDQTFEGHMLELVMRLSTIVHKGEFQYHATAPWPDCLSPYSHIPDYITDGHHDLLLWQWVNHFSTFFEGAARVQPPYTLGGTFYTYPDSIEYVGASAQVNLSKTFSLAEGLRPAIQKTFLETFQMITENLIEHMSSPGFREPNLLFYLAALYLYAIKKQYRFEDYYICLDDLLSAMRTYKERTIDVGVINSSLEEIYGRQPYQYDILAKFSPKWWDFLEGTSVGASPNFSSCLSIHDATSSTT